LTRQFPGAIDFIAVNHYATWYIGESDIYGNATAPYMGVECSDAAEPGTTRQYQQMNLDQINSRGVQRQCQTQVREDEGKYLV